MMESTPELEDGQFSEVQYFLVKDGPYHKCLSLLLFVLLFRASCLEGQHQVVCPSQPIVATVGDDIILPCHLRPAKNVSDMTVEWARLDLNPRFVHVWRDGVELESKKHPSYKGRTSVSIDKLKHGDISLTLSRVTLSDGGQYKCFIPGLGHSLIQLVVGAVSPPFIASINITSSGVVLQCESAGWHPEPEVLWLDGEGKLLSAGPTETVRGPDDLYTVSSRVTVEKRHSNSFTCRVQQRNINQTRETTTHISADFFTTPPSSSTNNNKSSCINNCVIALVVVFLCSLIVAYAWWNWKQNKSCHCGQQGSPHDETGHMLSAHPTPKPEHSTPARLTGRHIILS